jgi:hypothetical protein
VRGQGTWRLLGGLLLCCWRRPSQQLAASECPQGCRWQGTAAEQAGRGTAGQCRHQQGRLIKWPAGHCVWRLHVTWPHCVGRHMQIRTLILASSHASKCSSACHAQYQSSHTSRPPHLCLILQAAGHPPCPTTATMRPQAPAALHWGPATTCCLRPVATAAAGTAMGSVGHAGREVLPACRRCQHRCCRGRGVRQAASCTVQLSFSVLLLLF